MKNTTKYTPSDFEPKWQEKWAKSQIYCTPKCDSKNKKYVLDMFPYPSGAGLHVGHVEGYTATDIYCRYLRMNGYKVLHPMGFDSFGLPAENFAVKTGTHPKITTEKAIETFTQQMKQIGLSYDWNLMLAAHRPEYYKWTQWLFLLMYKRGLAYRKKQAVNWCEGCKTVLANEQVVDGKCERCETVVVQKEMEQWFLKITEYTERLLADLDKLDWPESTKAGQRNWIGKSEGAVIKFQVPGSKFHVEVFSTAHDTIFGATFLVLAPEHKLLDEITKSEFKRGIEEYKKAASLETEIERTGTKKEKTGVFTGCYAINPATGKEIPIWVSDYVLTTYGTGAIMAVPGADERDLEFAQKFDLPVVYVTQENEFVSYSKTIKANLSKYKVLNSGRFDGLTFEIARKQILDELQKKSLAEAKTLYKLRDWLISRQRFWGAPIPMKKSEIPNPKSQINSNTQDLSDTKIFEYKPVDESELPVVLPMDAEFKPTGKSPLTEHPDFEGREVDTMDTFVDSSWYFLRFAQLTSEKVRHDSQSGNEKNPFDDNELKKIMNEWCPVDLYVGGAEHTVLHLLYARFFTKVLFDAGYVNFDEPFLKLRHQGIIMGPDHRKMSKRWGNVINPVDVISQYGADTLRMYEMFMGPLKDMKAWNVESVAGVYRFLARVWNLSSMALETKCESSDNTILVALHRTIKKVTEDIAELKFNTAIAFFMEFINVWEKAGASKICTSDLKVFLRILAPFAPFITEELWSISGSNDSVHKEEWPGYNNDLLVEDQVEVPVQVNGKLRGTIKLRKVHVGDKDKALEMVNMNENILKYLTSPYKKIIYVPGKIMNIIL